jgi:HAD superfamily hydrolase (TIGR01484 family)
MVPFARYRERPAALFSDIDGTLTTGGVLLASTYAALVDVAAAGLPVVVVTGRPAGWADALIRMWPVAAAIAENGAVSLVRRGDRFDRLYAIPRPDIAGLRRRMTAALAEVCAEVSGAMPATDNAYREIDLAIDWNEEVHLPEADADRMVTMLAARGLSAIRSSVHVNFGPPGVDKLTACRRVVKEALGGDEDALGGYLFVGDSLNDAPLFGGFPHSVGVANIAAVWDRLSHRPRYVTAGAEGAGFEEVAAYLRKNAK